MISRSGKAALRRTLLTPGEVSSGQ